MYRVGIKRQFSAAHRLEGHPGKCARLHGHTWQVEAVFSTTALGQEEMVVDFEEAGRLLNAVIEPYDHQYLNELARFTSARPTAENVARFMFVDLLKHVENAGTGVTVESVTVWESPDSWASFGSA
ncbi:MAG TPA: 6-carboxytetrahydropterin synthase QueD [Candidatus Anoxymicrobiaceae bacterium]|jgi:6-pyruvoyltetrahydropterin/6-carboxytetrahydropterin synthase